MVSCCACIGHARRQGKGQRQLVVQMVCSASVHHRRCTIFTDLNFHVFTVPHGCRVPGAKSSPGGSLIRSPARCHRNPLSLPPSPNHNSQTTCPGSPPYYVGVAGQGVMGCGPADSGRPVTSAVSHTVSSTRPILEITLSIVPAGGCDRLRPGSSGNIVLIRGSPLSRWSPRTLQASAPAEGAAEAAAAQHLRRSVGARAGCPRAA